MQSQTHKQTAIGPENGQTAEEKVRHLRELFADAPEVGKTALENVLQRLATDASKTPPLAALRRLEEEG